MKDKNEIRFKDIFDHIPIGAKTIILGYFTEIYLNQEMHKTIKINMHEGPIIFERTSDTIIFKVSNKEKASFEFSSIVLSHNDTRYDINSRILDVAYYIGNPNIANILADLYMKYYKENNMEQIDDAKDHKFSDLRYIDHGSYLIIYDDMEFLLKIKEPKIGSNGNYKYHILIYCPKLKMEKRYIDCIRSFGMYEFIKIVNIEMYEIPYTNELVANCKYYNDMANNKIKIECEGDSLLNEFFIKVGKNINSRVPFSLNNALNEFLNNYY